MSPFTWTRARRSLARTAGSPGARERGDQGRFSSRRKMEAVLRLLRGEDLDALSRELGVSGATLGEWRERFLLSGQGGLKSRPEDDRDAEIRRLLAKVGELTMDMEVRAELLKMRGQTAPFPPRRSRP